MSELMTMAQMEAVPEGAPGTYKESWAFKILLNLLERQFPGIKDFIEKAADVLPWAKLLDSVLLAFKLYTEGKDFLTILKEVLSQWLVIEEDADGIRMTAKPVA